MSTIHNDYPATQQRSSNINFYAGIVLTVAVLAIAALGLSHSLGPIQQFWDGHRAILLGVSAALLGLSLHAIHEGTENHNLKNVLKALLIATSIAAVVGLCSHPDPSCLASTAGFAAASLVGYVFYNPRSMKKNICRIFHDAWKTAHVYLKGSLPSIAVGKDHCNYNAIETLSQNRMLNNSVITAVCNLLDNHQSKTVHEFTFQLSSKPENIPQNSDKQIIRIPVVLQRLGENHIIGVIVDKTSNVIKVFDPKGETISELGNICSGLSMNDFVKQLCTNFNISKVEQNTTKYQHDCHNCGVHVLQWFKERDLNEDPVTTRQNLIHDLVGNKDATEL